MRRRCAASAPYDEQVEIGSVNPLKRPTIRDVALVAGVSKSLVSLAFREPDRVAAAKLERIQAAAEKLGYVPNLSAQSLSSHSASFVGVIVVDLANPLQTELADRVRSELAARDIFALMTTAAPKNRRLDYADQVKRTLSAIRDLRPRGLIVVGTMPDMDALMQVSSASRVCVTSAIAATGHPVHVVRVDDALGIELALAELSMHECMRPVFVGGLGGAVSRARQQAFERLSAKWPQARVLLADYGYAAGLAAGQQLIVDAAVPGGELPDGVIAHNDLTAFGVQAAFLDAGLPLPRLVSFDNTQIAGFSQLAVSSLDHDNDAIAAEAVRWLFSDEPPGEVLVRPKLVRRGA